MHLQDARIALFNSLTFLISFSNVEQWLKIILLIAPSFTPMFLPCLLNITHPVYKELFTLFCNKSSS